MKLLRKANSGFHILRRRVVGMATKPGMFGVMASKSLLVLAARRNLPRLAAWLLAWQVRPVCRATMGGRPIIALILPKSGFAEDVQSSLVRDGRYTVMALHRKAVKTIANCFFGELVDDNNYRQEDAAITARKVSYRRFMIEVCRHLIPRLNLDVALTANFSFYAEQEFSAALDHFGIPVVAMHKECLKTPGVEPFYEYTYSERKMPFQGRLISTYNEIERRIQINAGVAPADRIVASGAPRLDRMHDWRREHAGQDQSRDGRPTVLFMSFNEKAGCPIIGRRGDERFEALDPEQERINWRNLVRNSHGAMVRLAVEHPEIQVIVKAKNHGLAMAALQDGFGKDFEAPDNLEIVIGGDPFELIVSCDVICGFNSTSLFEALSANVDVVVPNFDEAAEPLTMPYVVDLGGAATRAGSVDELIAMLAAKALERPARNRAGELSQTNFQTLEKWIGNPDGQAGARVSQLIMDLVQRRRQNAQAPDAAIAQEAQAIGS
ncbi:MAG: hypothetical protein HOK30_09340 [Rhodospirillaceae bacterium]|nr:hypothetical protein [Rhodospirillaceae bacterium]MBT5195879.1 hypothetical protein [Rhodospirillaceae bacterium]MBT5898741.1 hypothetical protein [Rhodospirillaceae bacterium]MBT6427851.1 hypothetical protein [Rhodospirillaceae bacterium]MBT7756558.1 hypothetical protein [Rhodospirillaceae bacterium]